MTENQNIPPHHGVPQQPQHDAGAQGNYYQAPTGGMPVQGYDANGQPFTAPMPVQGGNYQQGQQYQQPQQPGQYGQQPGQYQPAQQQPGQYGQGQYQQQYQQPQQQTGQHYSGVMPQMAPPAPPAAPSELSVSAAALATSAKAILRGNPEGAIDAVVGRKHVWWMALAAAALVTSLYVVMAMSRVRSNFWESMVAQYLPSDAVRSMGRSVLFADEYGAIGFGPGVGVVAVGVVILALYYVVRAAAVEGLLRWGKIRLPLVAALSITGVGQLPFVASLFVSFVLSVIPGSGFVQFAQWLIAPILLVGWLTSEMLTYACVNRVAQFARPPLLQYAVLSAVSTYVGAFLALLILFQVGGQFIG